MRCRCFVTIAILITLGADAAEGQIDTELFLSAVAVRVDAPAFVAGVDSQLVSRKKTSLLTTAAILSGTLIKIESDTLTLLVTGTESAALDVPVSEIRSLEAGFPTTHARSGALIGAAGGLLVGAAIGSTFKEDECAGLCLFESLESNDVKGGFWGLVIGGALGGLIGSRLPAIEWEPIQIGQFRFEARVRTAGTATVSAYVKL